MDINARAALYIQYYYDTGVDSGRYLVDIPFRNLDPDHRDKLIRDAHRAAKTGLLPQNKYWGEEWRWVLTER